MSRSERIRPTREETRQRLFAAAAEVFEARGIGGATIDAVVEAAGFSRGAFYSNFGSKDDLIIAMLEDHVEQSIRRNQELLSAHRRPADFLAALRAVDRGQQDPLGRSPMLHIELILYAARAEERRPELAERLRARRALAAEIVATTGSGAIVDVERSAAILVALEDGFRLHQLIDPRSTPASSFLDAVNALQVALGLVSG
jgi:AcrR family transcriptional regulator